MNAHGTLARRGSALFGLTVALLLATLPAAAQSQRMVLFEEFTAEW